MPPVLDEGGQKAAMFEDASFARYSRRHFFHTSAGLAAVGAAAFLTVGAIYGGIELGRDLFSIGQEESDDDPIYGAPMVDPKTGHVMEPARYMTDYDRVQGNIPVMKTPTGDILDLIGFTELNKETIGQGVYGSLYSVDSDDENLQPVSLNGKQYGRWYSVEALPIVEKGEVKTVSGYVKAVFLRRIGPVETAGKIDSSKVLVF